VVALGLAALVLWEASGWNLAVTRLFATSAGFAWRDTWLAVIITLIILVPLLKRVSSTSCPWDLAEFGGSVRYVQHWLPGVTDGGPGHCFPSGHAVSAFAFFGLYFRWREQRPKMALLGLALILLFGLAYGWAQLVRGAHFVSHSAWSAWLCWTLACVAAQGQRWLRTAAPVASARTEQSARAPAAAR
jgi:membrane-associated PAP2 superfamily phosphatase